eukprot:1153170-Pelagomonas_calceolata.AAC.2
MNATKTLQEKKNYVGSLPTTVKERETHLLRKAVTPLQHKAMEQTGLVGTWRATGSTWLHNLAARDIVVFKNPPYGMNL